MKLSICIPTYNRCSFLIDAIENTIIQAKEYGLIGNIEFCVSDNCSTDNTKAELLKLKNKFKDVDINLNFNEENIGPDRNFIKVMSMASGKYSILKGDDDYIKEGSLVTIFNLIEKNPSIGLFISDVDMVDTNHNYVGTVDYLREKYEELIVDFTNESEARSYFTLCNCVHALGSFISGVIYKTDATKCDFDESFIGTAYAFQYYFWKYLTSGHKLMYTNKKFIDASVGTQNVWDIGVARDALDIHAFSFIADYFFKEKRLAQDMKDVLNRMYNKYDYIPLWERKPFKEKLYPALVESNHPLLKRISNHSNPVNLLLLFIKSITPRIIFNIIKSKR